MENQTPTETTDAKTVAADENNENNENKARSGKKKRLILFFVLVLIGGAALLVFLLSPYLRAISMQEVKDVTYFKDSQDPCQTLDLLLPQRSGDEKPPLIVWIHGGAWKLGDKTDTPAVPFVKAGYAVASLNYRLTSTARFPAQIQDCKAAIRWLRANAEAYHFDPNKIGVFGMSAGGHLVALLGVTNDDRQFDDVGGNLNVSSNVQAVCDWSGITDLATLDKQSTHTVKLDGEEPDAPVKLFLGDRAGKVPAIAKRASPVAYISPKNPPFLIMHGDKDGVVPIEQSNEFYEKLKKNGVDAKFIVVKGGAHNFVSTETLTEVLRFFDSKLRS